MGIRQFFKITVYSDRIVITVLIYGISIAVTVSVPGQIGFIDSYSALSAPCNAECAVRNLISASRRYHNRIIITSDISDCHYRTADI